MSMPKPSNDEEVQNHIHAYLASQAALKRDEMQELHRIALQVAPGCKLWFFDGRNDEGKVIANPNIGYGKHTLKYANGDTREWFQIGISANTRGISVYVFGIEDKTFLSRTFGEKLGKASVSGYCIKFKTLKDIDVATLEAAIRFGFENRH